jgi:hypothetical protein
MSRLARTLVLAAALAAMCLTGTTAVAQAQTTEDDAVELFRRGERASPEQTSTDAVELFRRGERAWQEQMDRNARAQGPSGEQTPANATLQRVLAQEHHDGGRVPAEVTSRVRPAEQSGYPGWVLASLGLLAAVLAVTGALAVLAVRRASRKVRAGQPA